MHTKFNMDEWMVTATSTKPIFLSARVRLARNLMHYPFPQQASEKQRKEIFDTCSDVIMQSDGNNASICLQLDALDELTCTSLMEAHQISVDLAKNKVGAGVILNKKNKFAFMINEEDHLRLQVLDVQPNFKILWRRLDRLDSCLEQYLDYAFQPHLGYLTACPTNLGTGIRASAMLHLPGLVFTNQHMQVGRSLAEMGMILRGVYGEQSKAIGHIFQVSNQTSLGFSENELLDRVEHVIHLLVKKETEARKKLLRTTPHELFDNIGRALGILRACFEVGAEEATNLLSLIILAVDLGFFPKEKRRILYKIKQEIQPAHLQLLLPQPLKGKELNRERAKLLHRYFLKFPEPDFKVKKEEVNYVS
ncbi:MAG: ATP--guanido phosphotransferase [Puniceicoccales bacterium]|nr:ATP--guanido phosphotransferase [Puniceicoccales bacterium]